MTIMTTINLKTPLKKQLRTELSRQWCGKNTVLRKSQKKINNVALSHQRSNHFLTSPRSSSCNGGLLFHKVSNECGQLCFYGGCTVSEAACAPRKAAGVSAVGRPGLPLILIVPNWNDRAKHSAECVFHFFAGIPGS